MTVKELRQLLETMPDDAEVLREGGEHQLDYREVQSADYQERPTFGRKSNTVLIK